MLTKQQFLDYIDKIKATYSKQDCLIEAIEKICEGDSWMMGMYGNELNVMVELLSLAMGLEIKGQDENVLEYFIFQLDFGKDYTPDCFTEMDGTPIDISTPEKLYDYIIKEEGGPKP